MGALKLRLDFAPHADSRSTASVVFLLVALALLTVTGERVGRNLYANSQQQQDIVALVGKRVSAPPAAKTPERADPHDVARAQLVRQTSRQLSTPWSDLMGALESTPPTVALLTVEPSAAKRSVTLTAESSNAIDMLDYVGQLQGDARLSGVTLVSHQVQEQTPGHPLRFQLRANWGVSP